MFKLFHTICAKNYPKLQINISFAAYSASMNCKIKPNSCKWLADFSIEQRKNAKNTVEIIEKRQRNNETSRGVIDIC